jgi:hypothetical protein
MGTLSTVTNLLVMSAIGTTVTVQSLDLEAGNTYAVQSDGHYTALDENHYCFESLEESAGDTEKFAVLTNVASHLATTSSNIDPEFVKIVNEHFWDLI